VKNISFAVHKMATAEGRLEIAEDVTEMILKEMKLNPNIFNFGILLQEKKK
jgi:hypothetical protein